MGLQSAGRDPVLVPISQLHFDPRVWPREKLDHERVAMFASLYEEAGQNALPPVGAVRDKVLLLYDGTHRVAAAEAAGIRDLPTIVVEPPEDIAPVLFAYLRAIDASTGGAKQLTRTEIHAGIRRLIAKTELRDDQIAPLFGVSKATVWRERRKTIEGVSSETHDAEAGETYLAQTTAYEAATRLFKGLAKVYEARGLGVWDALTGDHTGSRLARVLTDAYGDEALEHAERFRGWIDDAISSLGEGGRR